MKRLPLSALIAALILIAGCSTFRGPKLEDLTKTAESFHKDLLFERYSVAAKSVTPALRAEYLQNINSQRLHFAEIEILSMDTCTPDKKDCVYVQNTIQWYAGFSPNVVTSIVTEKWTYDENSGLWLLVEQEQGK